MNKINIDEYNIRQIMENASATEDLKHRISDVITEISKDANKDNYKNMASQSQGINILRYRKNWLKVASIVLIFVIAIGGTVFAATRLIRFNIEQQAPHSVDVAVELDEDADNDDGSLLPAEVSEINIEVNYMTPDMEAEYKGPYSYSSLDSEFGYFISELYMDTGGIFSQDFVTDSKTINIGNHEAAFVSTQSYSTDPEWLQQYLYVAYPEFDRVIEIHGWGHAKEEELIKIAEGLVITETGATIPFDNVATWSNYRAYMNGELTDEDDVVTYEEKLVATKDEMHNLHRINETFATDIKDLSAKVTGVQIADDLSLLDAGIEIPDEWLSLADDQGKLQPAVRSYLKYGDGKTSLNEIVDTEEYPVDLVYVSIDLTNTGSEDMHDVWYFAYLIGLEEIKDGYQLYDPYFEYSYDGYDEIVDDALTGFGEMFYYDVHGGERNNNYINEIKAGETQTIHVAWIIPKDDLDKMFLDISGHGGLSDEALDIGLVDIRQE